MTMPEEKGAHITVAPPHETLTDEQAARKLKLFREHAQNDLNIPTEDLDDVDNALQGHDVSKENELVAELLDDSPYPEVCLRPRPWTMQTISIRELLLNNRG
jgi:hypothetical protein